MYTIESAQKALDEFLEIEKIENSPLAACLQDVLKIATNMQEDVDFLACLTSAGVDNWSGYEQAQEMRSQ